MGANCDSTSQPTLQGNLLNHSRMTSLMYYHEVLGNQLADLDPDVQYVLGETNSISVSLPILLSSLIPTALYIRRKLLC